MIYSLCIVLIAVGLYGVLVKRNIVKIVISLLIMEYGANLLLILIGTRILGGDKPGNAPIMDAAATTEKAKAAFVATSVDPLPQALVLTAIVIGLGVLALMVAICLRLYERYGTFDIDEMRRLKG